MRCEKCQFDVKNGEANCPNCGAKIHYAGKTELYNDALRSQLSFKDLFSDTFKSHSVGAMEKLLTVGTSQTTPSPQRMILEWDKPWLYMRVFLIGLVVVALIHVLKMEGLRAGQTLMMTLPVFIMPLTVLTFFWEINIPRNISIFKVLMIFVFGGLLSIASIMFFGHGEIPDDAAQYAAFTEEPAKLLVTALFVHFMNPRYIFGGLLIGASVGAGFGAFESFDYVVHSGDFYMDQMIYRSVNIFGAHLMWAAIEGGALVMVKGKAPLKLSHFADSQFLPYLAISMSLHFIGNYDIRLTKIPFFLDLKYLLICIVSIYVIGILVNKAIVQVLRAADMSEGGFIGSDEFEPISSDLTKEATLTALNGPLAGKVYPFRKTIKIGRLPTCNVVFPPKTPEVSREHCELQFRADGVYIMDLNSKFGTFLQNGRRLTPNKWTRCDGRFYLGSTKYMFSVGQRG